jgi:hypothetical protein
MRVGLRWPLVQQVQLAVSGEGKAEERREGAKAERLKTPSGASGSGAPALGRLESRNKDGRESNRCFPERS